MSTLWVTRRNLDTTCKNATRCCGGRGLPRPQALALYGFAPRPVTS